MSGNTGSTNNAATRELKKDYSDLQAAYRDLHRTVTDLRAERDRQAAEIGRLQSQISDMRRSLPMKQSSRLFTTELDCTWGALFAKTPGVIY